MQLTFLTFGAMQCYFSLEEPEVGEGEKNWRQCERTLFSQTGLGEIVFAFLTIKFISAISPTHILERHIPSIKKMITLKLEKEEWALLFGLALVFGATLFLLGFYGAEGACERGTVERSMLIAVSTIGAGVLWLIALWKVIVIRQEVSR